MRLVGCGCIVAMTVVVLAHATAMPRAPHGIASQQISSSPAREPHRAALPRRARLARVPDREQPADRTGIAPAGNRFEVALSLMLLAGLFGTGAGLRAAALRRRPWAAAPAFSRPHSNVAEQPLWERRKQVAL